MRPWRHTLLALVMAMTLLGHPSPVQAWTTEAEVLDIIYDRAAAHGVSGTRLERVARCESRLDPFAVGDHGQSLGLFQLYRHGLLPRFYAMGYSDPFSAWEAADFAARMFAEGLSFHWTCGRRG